MEIRKATEADIPAVTAIYDALLDREEQGLLTTGWTRGVYPTEQTARDSLAAGTLYVLEDGGRVTAAAKIWRSIPNVIGSTTRRRSRCWCSTRWWSIRR